jgi:hypothetical protein
MSKYHQYPEYSDRVVARYQKTIPCKIAGIRLNPHDDVTRMDFLLESREENFEGDSVTFNYRDDIVELYSDKEARMFKSLNAKLFEEGVLVPYSETPAEVRMDNTLSDVEVKALAKFGTKEKFAEKLREFDSWVPVSRILAQLDENSPVWRRDLVMKRLEELRR